MTSGSLILRNLKKSFDQHIAISNVSLEIPKGKLTVLLGPSGCGKSTLLRMIAGFEAPTNGAIYIGDKQIDQLPSSARDISMVFQSYALFPHMTVADNILFGLQVRKIPKDAQNSRLKHVTDLMGLSQLLGRKPSQLSGGQQQRVALARAVISERPVCLMDEPLSNLDAKLRHEMRVEIRKLQQKLELTMVYVTHDQVEAITMADQIVLLNNGKIEQVGSPREIYDQPESTFAARFIGAPAMNLIPVSDLIEHCTDSTLSKLPHGMICGIRPEEITISQEKGLVRSQLCDVEYQGADQLLTCKIGSTSIDIRVPASSAIDDQGHMFLSWRPEALHLFDETTTKRTMNAS